MEGISVVLGKFAVMIGWVLVCAAWLTFKNWRNKSATPPTENIQPPQGYRKGLDG